MRTVAPAATTVAITVRRLRIWWLLPRFATLGGCPRNHRPLGRNIPGRAAAVARPDGCSLPRRATPGAHPARRASSVVAALPLIAPRLVRLAHHDYSYRSW